MGKGEPFPRGSFGWWVSVCITGVLLGVLMLVIIGLGIRLVELAWP